MPPSWVVAALLIEDELKPDTKRMIQSFIDNGIEPVMLSGDKKERCESLAQQLGIKKIFSEQLPEQKLEIIRKLSKEKNITMVGDGVNDAPALSLAQTGVSMSDATQVAVNAAQIVLLQQNRMMSLFEAWKLSKLILRTIKQNLFWAFFYNVLAIPLAAFGYLSPMIAAFSMAFSDVIVIGNSIWLKTKRL
jgi:Cu+-exporting ATPase